MDILQPFRASGAGDLATWIGAVAAFGTMITAMIAGRVAVKTLRQMRRDSAAQAEDSRARSRPYLYAYIQGGLAGRDWHHLVIKNFGASAAWRIEIEITPHAGAYMGDKVAQDTLKAARALKFLPPGGNFSAPWAFSWGSGFSEGFQGTFNLEIVYHSTSGRYILVPHKGPWEPGPTTFVEKFELDQRHPSIDLS